ncbi:hypothetical protein [uncultured Sphingomonas sp.]|uniref:hypothetical protein n=1 Tax=uncultured Sphingomonas sp. TaxID=158754 RepID=UPI0035CBAE6F
MRRLSWLTGFVASAVLAALCDLLSMLVTRTQGVRFGEPTDQPSATGQLIFWGVVSLFAIFNGAEFFHDVVAFEARRDKDSKVGDVALVFVIVIAVWLALVWNGSKLLTAGLLN